MKLMDLVRAGYPAVVYKTAEEERALAECRRIAKANGLDFASWSLTKGFQKSSTKASSSTPITDPVQTLRQGLELKANAIYCLLDFHPYIRTPNVWRTLKDVLKEGKPNGITFVFIGVQFDIPIELKHEMIVSSLELPTREDLFKLLSDMANGLDYTLSEEEGLNAVEAALGLTLGEAENAFAVSLAKEEKLDAKVIGKVKEQIICNGGILEFKSSNETLESIGGLKNFTTWAMNRLSAYSPKAQEYGLPYPRGVMLIGIPGCGKSLTAKALANMWQKPLLKLDVGKLFGSLVGDTEANTRQALETAEAMAPAILWIDEIEKAFSGVQASGKTDSGVTSRMFGTILTWLQEKKAPVFVMATANNISQLPAEFLRKGRFDEIFFVDLPDMEERIEIFNIQLKKYKRDSNNFSVVRLATLTENYTGAEIEECIVSAMFTAWNDGEREVTDQDIVDSINTISPMAEGVMKEQVENLRTYSESYAIRRANGNKTSSETAKSKTQRVIRSAKK